jgi:hypothetical protein
MSVRPSQDLLLQAIAMRISMRDPLDPLIGAINRHLVHGPADHLANEILDLAAVDGTEYDELDRVLGGRGGDHRITERLTRDPEDIATWGARRERALRGGAADLIEDVPVYSHPAGASGAYFALLPLPHQSGKAVNIAIAKLQRSRDVVSMEVIRCELPIVTSMADHAMAVDVRARAGTLPVEQGVLYEVAESPSGQVLRLYPDSEQSFEACLPAAAQLRVVYPLARLMLTRVDDLVPRKTALPQRG